MAEVAAAATVEVAAAAYQKMTAAEKEVFKRKMAEYDEAITSNKCLLSHILSFLCI